MAITVTFAFIGGLFEPIEQWGLKAHLGVQESFQQDEMEIFPLRVDNHFAPLTLPSDAFQMAESNFQENELCSPPCTPRWSKVSANAYTISGDKVFGSSGSWMIWEPEVMTLWSQGENPPAINPPAINPARVSEPVLIFLIFAASFVAVWLSRWFRRAPGIGLVGLLGVVYWGTVYGFVTHIHIWVDLLPVPLALVCGWASSFTKGLIPKKSTIAGSVSTCSLSHTPPPSAKYSPLPISQQRRMVTVLFVDIRGFSRFAEALSPEEVRDFLDEYFTEMTEAVVSHGGTIDKYMGDAVMALFNAPHSQTDHADRAVSTALDCQRRLQRLSGKIQKRYGCTLTCGIGLHTGEALIGTMGSAQRTDFTAVGDSVNLAANLEELSKVYQVPIVMSESTQQGMVTSYHSRYLDAVRVKGRERFLRIHTVIDGDDRKISRVPGKGRAIVRSLRTQASGKISDWSSGGIALEQLDQPIGEGRLLDLTLYSSESRLPYCLQATVVWSQSHRAGLKFIESDLDPDPDPRIEHGVSCSSWEQYTKN